MGPILGSSLHVRHVCTDGLNPCRGRTDFQSTLSNGYVLCVNWFDEELDHSTGR